MRPVLTSFRFPTLDMNRSLSSFLHPSPLLGFGDVLRANQPNTLRYTGSPVLNTIGIPGSSVEVLKFDCGSRSYAFGIHDADGAMTFRRNDGYGLGIKISSNQLELKPSTTGCVIIFEGRPTGGGPGTIFTPDASGSLGIAQFGRRFSDSHPSVGASSEFWPRSGMTLPVICTVKAGGGTGGASPVQYRFTVNEEGNIYLKSETSTTSAVDRFSLASSWADSTHVTRRSRAILSTYDYGGTRNCLTLEASGTAPMIGFLGASAITRPSAYTQNYSTADRTLNAYTPDVEGADYTGINNLQPGNVYAQVSDLNALRAAYENLRAFVEDLAQHHNSVLDDLQLYGLLQ